ncbi:MAG: DUF883 family protein [Candidatus Accumulibacter sp.]|nr:DUF883 family protein [Accumulibacter sp.]
MMTTETHPGQDPIEGRMNIPAPAAKKGNAGGNGAEKSASTSTPEELSAARTLIAERLRQTRTRLVEARAVVADKAKCTAQATDAYVKDHPWQMLGVAAAAGVLAGVLLSRR